MSDEAEQVLAALRRTGRVLRKLGWSSDYSVDSDSGAVGLFAAVEVAVGVGRVAFDEDTWWLESSHDGPDVGHAVDTVMLVWDALRDTLRARGEGVPSADSGRSVLLARWGCRQGRTEAEILALVDETIARLSAGRVGGLPWAGA